MIFQNTYSLVAEEYYDPILHPTCANFRELGLKGLAQTLPLIARSKSLTSMEILETGAGKSTVAEIFSLNNLIPNRLTIQDKHWEMLQHSQRWENQVRKMYLSDARDLGVPDSSYDCVFSFLLDPYDTENLWREISRVLRPGSRWIISSPSHYWATKFRTLGSEKSSMFIGPKGEDIELPSYTFTPYERIRNLQGYGFSIEYYREFLVDDIEGPVSGKLILDAPKNPVLDYFIFAKMD